MRDFSMGYDDKKQENRLSILFAAARFVARRLEWAKVALVLIFAKKIARAFCSHPGPNDSVQMRHTPDCRKRSSDRISNSLGLAGRAELR
jgi:hypothetical protein